MKINLLVIAFLVSFNIHAQEIALTFDDAPMGNGPLYSGLERTSKIIDKLKTNGALQVAFFVVTGNIDSIGSIRLKQYAAAGHLLANHTHTHEWIRNIGTKNYIAGIIRADSILRKMPGFRPWFRYPFLDEGKTIPVRDSIRNALLASGLQHGYVTVDDYDWYLNQLLRNAITSKASIDYEKLRRVYIHHVWNSVLFYDSVAKKILNRSPKHVLLLHENDMSALFIGDLIQHIKSKGWKIIPVEEAYNDPLAKNLPDVLFNGQGRIAAIASENGVPVQQLVQDSEDETVLDETVKKNRVFK
jgi:peptidoglycan/xylan/chitin deacetylase (PgdA/CDA1 family)